MVPNIQFVTEATSVSGSDIVVINLDEHREIGRVREIAPEAHVVAYGGHNTINRMDKASLEIANEVLPRSKFFADPSAAMLDNEEQWEA